MKFHRVIRTDNLKGPSQNISHESAGNVGLQKNLPFTVLPQHTFSKQAIFLTDGCLLQTQKISANPLTSDSIYDDSHRSNRKIDMLDPGLQSSLSTGAEIDQQQLGNFLPSPGTDDLILHAFNTPDTSLLLEGDVISGFNSDQCLEMGYLDIPVETSGRGSQGIDHAKESLTLCEKLRLQYLSKELDIPIDYSIENASFGVSKPSFPFFLSEHTVNFAWILIR